jgi:hypothetical protein
MGVTATKFKPNKGKAKSWIWGWGDEESRGYGGASIFLQSPAPAIPPRVAPALPDIRNFFLFFASHKQELYNSLGGFFQTRFNESVSASHIAFAVTRSILLYIQKVQPGSRCSCADEGISVV